MKSGRGVVHGSRSSGANAGGGKRTWGTGSGCAIAMTEVVHLALGTGLVGHRTLALAWDSLRPRNCAGVAAESGRASLQARARGLVAAVVERDLGWIKAPRSVFRRARLGSVPRREQQEQQQQQ